MYEVIVIFTAQYLYLFIAFIAASFFIVTRQGKRPYEIAIIATFTFAIALLIDKILNQIIDSPRPFTVENVTPLFFHTADNGFPSEHTLLAAVLAGIVFVYHKKTGVFLGFLAAAVGIARVLANVHRPIDILGSFIIAIVSIYIARQAVLRFQSYRGKRPSLTDTP